MHRELLYKQRDFSRVQGLLHLRSWLCAPRLASDGLHKPARHGLEPSVSTKEEAGAVAKQNGANRTYFAPLLSGVSECCGGGRGFEGTFTKKYSARESCENRQWMMLCNSLSVNERWV